VNLNASKDHLFAAPPNAPLHRAGQRSVSNAPQIVVLTPVKNESWILERFLAATSCFADLILIADQNSTDESASIARKFSKVHLLENKSETFNESERQLTLIRKARELVRGRKILLGFDADEILAANATEQLGWQTMLAAKPGTTLYFEKPELYPNPGRCIRWDTPWPIGYVDDGAEHVPRAIHSIRVPRPPGGQRLVLNDIKVLHYSFCRPDAHRAKMRYYSVIENVLGSQPLRRRLRTYKAEAISASFPEPQETPREWLEDWERRGIDMHSIGCEQFYWHDFEVLRQFAKHGTRRFWFDDVWEMDWEECRRVASAKGIIGLPAKQIKTPPKMVGLLRRQFQNLVRRPRTKAR